MADIDRFWAKVKKTDGCWLWQAACHPGGYGKLYFRGRVQAAHRVAWTLLRGEVPAGLVVMHACDNRKCVNPEHLSVGTQAENLRDMRTKGRHAHGALHYRRFRAPEIGESSRNAKLTNEQARQIIHALLAGQSRKKLAAQFCVSKGTIHAIALRKNWAWLWEDINRGPAEMKIVVGPGS